MGCDVHGAVGGIEIDTVDVPGAESSLLADVCVSPVGAVSGAVHAAEREGEGGGDQEVGRTAGHCAPSRRNAVPGNPHSWAPWTRMTVRRPASAACE